MLDKRIAVVVPVGKDGMYLVRRCAAEGNPPYSVSPIATSAAASLSQRQYDSWVLVAELGPWRFAS